MNTFFHFQPRQTHSFQIEAPKEKGFSPYDKTSHIHPLLEKNIDVLKHLLYYPHSNDLVFRFFEITINEKKYHAFLLLYDGLCDTSLMNDYILRQLMTGITVKEETNKSILKKKTLSQLQKILAGDCLSESQIRFAQTYEEVITSILHGDCALLVDSLDTAIISDVKKIPSRSINKSENEMTVKGPSEAFVENFRSNTALIRKFVKDENLIFETVTVGKRSKTNCAIAYIANLTNDSLLQEVRRRIQELDIDYLLDSGQLEQLIEDHTFIVEPLILSTERPDKVAANLTEGRIAILVENSPNVLIVPTVYTDFMRSSEDSYIRYPYTLLLRFFRIPAVILSVLLPRFIHRYYHLSSRDDSHRFIVFHCRDA